MDKIYQTVPYVLDHSHGGAHASTRLGREDPRLRILAAAGFSILVALARQFPTLGAALAAAVIASATAGLSFSVIRKRLLPLNLLMLLLLVLLPLTTQGTPLGSIGPLAFSKEGLLLAAAIAIKGNAIMLAILALMGSLDATTIGHALSHLHVPEKLTNLLLFTVRYVDVLHREGLRLRAAMKVRGFRPRMDRHTYRSYGYLVGMLLVRSFDRSERIVAAMKCRGFQGRFFMLDHFALSRRDAPFAVASMTILIALSYMEWFL
jgi:cobalt/nickel transport system permease protein